MRAQVFACQRVISTRAIIVLPVILFFFFFFALSDREAFATEIPPRLRGHDLKAAKSQLFPAADSKKLEEINLGLTYDLPIC